MYLNSSPSRVYSRKVDSTIENLPVNYNISEDKKQVNVSIYTENTFDNSTIIFVKNS